MISTKITKMFGCAAPIIGGAMHRLSKAPFVAALCNAGTLGVVTSASYFTEEEFRDDLRRLQDLTDRPFAVNINLFPALKKIEQARLIEIALEQGVKNFETSGPRAPEDLALLLKKEGNLWMHKCVGLRYAKKAESLGADVVTVVGFENGGATGVLYLGSMVLIPLVAGNLKVPVIGGGGVADGRGVAAVLCLGAEGVIVGTRFLLAEECPIHPDLKRALCEADELSTAVIMESLGFGHRTWMNSAGKKALEIEKKGGGLAEMWPYISGEQAEIMFNTGDLNAGAISCSQGIGLMNKVMPAKDIVQSMLFEAQEILKRKAALIG
jgi:nitronate monooxygenase